MLKSILFRFNIKYIYTFVVLSLLLIKISEHD
jgi:hypothetical protein